MKAIRFTKPVLSELKKEFAKIFPSIKSSHLSEALAASAGFSTHAALLTALKSDSLAKYKLDLSKFQSRASDLGYGILDLTRVDLGVMSMATDAKPMATAFEENALEARALFNPERILRVMAGQPYVAPDVAPEYLERYYRLRAKTIRQQLEREDRPLADDYYSGVVSMRAESLDDARNLINAIDSVWPKHREFNGVRHWGSWYESYHCRDVSSNGGVDDVFVEIDFRSPMTVRSLYDAIKEIIGCPVMLQTLRALPAAKNPMDDRKTLAPPEDWVAA